jgi:hypothetical protein
MKKFPYSLSLSLLSLHCIAESIAERKEGTSMNVIASELLEGFYWSMLGFIMSYV